MKQAPGFSKETPCRSIHCSAEMAAGATAIIFSL